MKSSLTRLLRVRRLMEEMSRADFADRRMEQAELEERREAARETAVALRGEARAVLVSGAGTEGATPGLWKRLLADSEASGVAEEHWHRAAHAAAVETGKAERKYLEDRRSRMQAEILVQERMAAERLEQERREQREIDDWFGMSRGAVAARRRSEDSPI